MDKQQTTSDDSYSNQPDHLESADKHTNLEESKNEPVAWNPADQSEPPVESNPMMDATEEDDVAINLKISAPVESAHDPSQQDSQPVRQENPSVNQFVLQVDPSQLPGDIKIDPSQDRRKNKKNKRYIKEKITPMHLMIKIFVSMIIIGVVAGISVVMIFSIQDIMGFSKGNDEIDIHIKQGDSIPMIAKNMEESGLIRSALLFRAYLKTFFKQELIINYGKYSLNKNMSYSDMIESLQKMGQTTNAKITVVEGYNIRQIAQELEEKMVCTEADFLQEINHGTWLDDKGNQRFSFMEELLKVKDLDQRPYRLEGYLFPDTYEFETNTPANKVVQRFLAQFENKFDSHMRYLTRLKKFTIDDIVKLASIVEGEASGIIEQMPRVSSVYWNRLNNPNTFPKLEADPTTRYARDVLTPQGVSPDTIKAYDTYQVPGMPLGPINSPGYKAIEATLKPVEEDYYFFVTSKNMKIFYYAKTYEKHQENIEKAKQNEPD